MASSVKPFVTGLGSDVDALAAQSPLLQGQLKQLINTGWGIGYGKVTPDGTAPPSLTFQKSALVSNPYIEIAPTAQGKGPAHVVQQLFHEVGHALHPVTPDMSSRQAYIDSNLTGEGWATMNNLAVRQEIRAATGTDIGIASRNPLDLAPKYQVIYGESRTTGDAEGAAQAIGRLYGQHEITEGKDGVPYSDDYGRTYVPPAH